MSTKLNWVWQNRAKTPEYCAEYKGLVIRAVHDEDPENPFTSSDCQWPIVVRSPNAFDDFQSYACGSKRNLLAEVLAEDTLAAFNDAALIHNQVHIAKILRSTVYDLIECYETVVPVKYCRDADLLRSVFVFELAGREGSRLLELAHQLHTLAGMPAHVAQVTGHCQGDWADVLVLAPPETQREFGLNFESFIHRAKTLADVSRIGIGQPLDDWIWNKACELMLASTAKLYGAWAWGDVYGYVLAREVTDADGETELEDIDDVGASCWDYYGSDFDESGLEDAAIEAAHCLDDDQMTPELLAAQTKGAW